MTTSDQAPAAARSFYPEDDILFRELATAEERHFWFLARNQVIAAALRRATRSLPPDFRTLEIGCGTGNVLRLLEKISGAGNVVGMDMLAGGLRYARQRTHCGLVQGDMHAPPFNTQFHVIGMFDVIEHLSHDVGALTSARALLAPGGKLLLTVPADMSLWSYADELAGHQRRYDRRQLQEKLAAAGFRVDYITYFMAATYPIMWLKRRATSLAHRGHSPEQARDLFLAELRPVPVVNGILRWLGEREANLIAAGRGLPFGTSLLAIATRPEE